VILSFEGRLFSCSWSYVSCVPENNGCYNSSCCNYNRYCGNYECTTQVSTGPLTIVTVAFAFDIILAFPTIRITIAVRAVTITTVCVATTTVIT